MQRRTVFCLGWPPQPTGRGLPPGYPGRQALELRLLNAPSQAQNPPPTARSRAAQHTPSVYRPQRRPGPWIHATTRNPRVFSRTAHRTGWPHSQW